MITRNDFYDNKQVEILCRFCRDKAWQDLRKGRFTWPKRWMIVDLALYTGLRCSELRRVTVGHIHLKEAFMDVFRSKGGKHGTLPLSKNICEHLKDHITLFDLLKADDFLLGRKGKQLSLSGIADHWIKAVEATDLPRITIHGARHTCVSNIIAKHGMKAAQEWVKHASIQTTIDVYGHIPYEKMQDIGESMYK